MARERNTDHYDNIFERNVNFRERVIYLNDDVDECSLELVMKALDEMDKNPEAQIRIEISSYGGSVYDMMGIVDRIRSSPCHIITRGWGKIMSAATFILAAGDERLMGRHSWLMIHEISDWIKGTLSDLKIQLKHTETLEKQMCMMYEEFSKGTTKARTFEKLCERDCYLTSEETLKLGLIDRIVSES